MGAAIAYEDIYGKNSEKFERVFRRSLDEADALRRVEDAWDMEKKRAMLKKMLASVDNLALMTMLSVKDDIPMRQDLIERIRELYISLNDSILENPVINCLDDISRAEFEKACMDLARAVCAADIANSEEIAAVLKGRKTYA